MAVPDFQSLMRPRLAVHQDGQPHTPTDLRDRIAAQMHVSDEDRAVLLPSGRQALFSNRVAWAVTHRERVQVKHALAHVGHWQGRRARYRGSHKNLFDLRRVAVVHNLHITARQTITDGYQVAA